MAVTPAVSRLVWAKAGAMCAMPECRKFLVEPGKGPDGDTLLGEVAHIVAQHGQGPRADAEPPGGERDGEANLLLLCPEHHLIVDRRPSTYTVPRLIGIKADHERWVREVWEREKERNRAAPATPTVSETVHSTLLPVERMPRHVFMAPCRVAEGDVRARLRQLNDREVILPFIVRERKLITFYDLTVPHGPFADVIDDQGAVERHEGIEWWRNPDLSNWYVTLLNRALNKLTGRLGLRLDTEHHRYYFEPERSTPESPPAPREVSYRPLNKATSTKQVVWQPRSRRTGEVRGRWTHLALGLRFHRVSPTHWILSLRPERRFTTDGYTPLAPKQTGRRSTSLKSHMYNHEVLTEVQFWKEFVSRGTPRILFLFGDQSMVVQAELMTTVVEWPGVPDDQSAFANTSVTDDLFTVAAYDRALRSDSNLDDDEGQHWSDSDDEDEDIGEEEVLVDDEPTVDEDLPPHSGGTATLGDST